MSIDLDKMDRDELQDLKKRIEETLKAKEKSRKRDAYVAMEAVAAKYGFTIDEVIGAQPASKLKKALPPKYQNPDNPTETWSGRGRQPQWFKDKMEAGADMDAMKIAA